MQILEIKKTPLGTITLAGGPDGMNCITYGDISTFQVKYPKFAPSPQDDIYLPSQEITSMLERSAEEICAYLTGELREFTNPIDWSGMTPFQVAVRKACLAIPYGKTITYKELARNAGFPNAIRAAGAANGSNPLPLLIPCHRVIGSDGKMHGYGGPKGVETKTWLLKLESNGAPDPKNISSD